MNSTELTNWIKSHALASGFLAVGMAPVKRLDEVDSHLSEWLDRGYQGDMTYMERHREQRVDPSVLVPGARSVISLAYNYFTPAPSENDLPKIATYAYGKDYHKVLKKKLKVFWGEIKTHCGREIKGRYFVDSAPVMERQWAALAGLGWQGKNTLLIHPKHGSYFFLAEIICDLELEYDQPINDHCGTCTRCIDACPTQAIAEDGYLMNASQCISYQTIETKKDIPSELSDKIENWVFGCDICQQVCPWNKFSKPHEEPVFEPGPFLQWNKEEWEGLTEDQFNSNFGHTPLKRAGFDKFKRSIKTVLEQ